MQQIVSQLLFNGETDIDTQAMSLWIEGRIPPKDVELAAAESADAVTRIESPAP